ncbi:hypothetical protein QAD02_007462 [Eretmocerus hayati]|uniref:Uncharacterized protein n=1 Tax=Eretmocerus hayati TaxID=131215 RepID=A0ACC2N3N8_9HYME|nr:hypothetical protein QAD02_007462 [Eretmocerus hayati]
MAYVIDFQGFRSFSSEFVFKEVAILSTEKGAQPRVFLFKPPHGWNQLPSKLKSENRWLEKNYIGISWSEGDIPYDELKATLQDALKNSTRVFVKGGEKKRLLDKIIPNVEDLEAYGSPSISHLCKDAHGHCSHHTLCVNARCAAQTVHCIREWMDYGRARTSVDKDVVDSMYN